MSKVKTTEDLEKEFQEASGDGVRWLLVLANKGRFRLWLDNDVTGVVIDEGEESFHFDEYVGWHAGVCILLDTLGINADPV